MSVYPINDSGVALVKEFEGLRLTAYKDPAGIVTIGYGHTSNVSRTDIDRRTTITAQQADNMLADDLDRFARGVSKLLTAPANENQFAALVSLAFNIGLSAFSKSSVLRYHNQGNTPAAAAAFTLWNKATISGKKTVLKGLVSRRAAEAALYLTASDEQHKNYGLRPDDAETPLLSKAERAAGVAVAGAPVLQAFSGVDWKLAAVFGLVSIVAVGIFIWYRMRQRDGAE